MPQALADYAVLQKSAARTSKNLIRTDCLQANGKKMVHTEKQVKKTVGLLVHNDMSSREKPSSSHMIKKPSNLFCIPRLQWED